VALDGDEVLLGGEAVIVAEGTWRTPASTRVTW
jgi:hypothetical protein